MAKFAREIFYDNHHPPDMAINRSDIHLGGVRNDVYGVDGSIFLRRINILSKRRVQMNSDQIDRGIKKCLQIQKMYTLLPCPDYLLHLIEVLEAMRPMSRTYDPLGRTSSGEWDGTIKLQEPDPMMEAYRKYRKGDFLLNTAYFELWSAIEKYAKSKGE